MGVGRHGLDALDLQERKGVQETIGLYRQRLELSVARPRGRSDVDIHHTDSVGLALVHPLAGLAIRAG